MTTVSKQIQSTDEAICRNIESLTDQRALLSQNVLSQLRNLMSINKPRIIGLMGHAANKLVDAVYGLYVNGLERDLDAIKEYYGEDFWGHG